MQDPTLRPSEENAPQLVKKASTELPSFARLMLRLPLGLLFYGLLLFLPAGTWRWTSGWMLLGAFFIPTLLISPYLYFKHPALMARRLKMREREGTQKGVMAAMAVFWLGAMVLGGLDFRYGWSQVPFPLIVAGNLTVLFSYVAVFWVFVVNEFAARTIEVEQEQKVISTGPYAVVRHPMYSFLLTLAIGLPVGLGSWWALLFLAPTMPLVLAVRLLNEEKILRRDLEGYNEYCEKVRFRLIPYVW
jgi:protein-S-isoprenylcysteine O-methyltransferase Ste14